MKKKIHVWETIAVFGAILSLWPAVLRYWASTNDSVTFEDLPLGHIINWAHPAWEVPMYIALALMAVVAVMRVRRVRRAGDNTDGDEGNPKGGNSAGGGPIDPYGSMSGGQG